jgi:hypothetical protein
MQRGLCGRRLGLFVSLLGLAAVCALNGCQAPPKPMSAPPADDETLRLIRQSFTAVDPTASVGLVIAVLPDQMWASVGDVDVNDFKAGDAVSFIDSNKKFLVNGLVKEITPNSLAIQYETPAADSRAPKVGDLAVRFKP